MSLFKTMCFQSQFPDFPINLSTEHVCRPKILFAYVGHPQNLNDLKDPVYGRARSSPLLGSRKKTQKFKDLPEKSFLQKGEALANVRLTAVSS